METNNWNTVHDTANRTMTHEFEMGFTVVVDWGNKQLKVFKNGDLVSKVDLIETRLSITQYEHILISVEDSVKQLKHFQNADTEH